MLNFVPNQLVTSPVDKPSSVSIILVTDENRQVVDAQITKLEAYEILWLFEQIKKYGFEAVEETLVHYLIASKNDHESI